MKGLSMILKTGSARTISSRAVIVALALSLATMFLAQSSATASPPPPGGDAGCIASITKAAKVSGKIVGVFTIKCVKAQIIFNINGFIEQVGGKQVQDRQGKVCRQVKTCSQTLTWGTDPSGKQTYHFYFDPSATWAGVNAPNVMNGGGDATYECEDMGCMPKSYMLTLTV